jgi:hypothetical protein
MIFICFLRISESYIRENTGRIPCLEKKSCAHEKGKRKWVNGFGGMKSDNSLNNMFS